MLKRIYTSLLVKGLNIPCPPHDYASVANHFALVSLADVKYEIFKWFAFYHYRPGVDNLFVRKSNLSKNV